LAICVVTSLSKAFRKSSTNANINTNVNSNFYREFLSSQLNSMLNQGKKAQAVAGVASVYRISQPSKKVNKLQMTLWMMGVFLLMNLLLHLNKTIS
jgi:hypothetical protein